jgi:hypothetical protein
MKTRGLMEKKESLNSEVELKPKISGISGKVFGIIKFILGLVILPFVYSSTVSFLKEFQNIQHNLQDYFWVGIISFLVIYLFIWEPTKVYIKGQKILEAIFRFFAPLVKVAPYLLPIYFILIFLGYLTLSVMIKQEALLSNSLFLLGFALALHLVFSAKTMRSRQSDFLKANYIFGFSLIYIINLLLLAFCLNIIFDKFSFVNFCNYSFEISKGIFSAVFKQLFL